MNAPIQVTICLEAVIGQPILDADASARCLTCVAGLAVACQERSYITIKLIVCHCAL